MIIVLVSGKAESGKTTTCKILKELLEKEGKGVLKMSYGDYVKDTAKKLWGWDGKKDEKGRALLQWWGTDFVRVNHKDFWAETLVRLAEVIKDKYDYILIDDARFPNEIDVWKNKGFDIITVRVFRPFFQNSLTDEQREHPSEVALDTYDFDVKLVATDLTDLSKEIDRELLPFLK